LAFAISVPFLVRAPRMRVVAAAGAFLPPAILRHLARYRLTIAVAAWFVTTAAVGSLSRVLRRVLKPLWRLFLPRAVVFAAPADSAAAHRCAALPAARFALYAFLKTPPLGLVLRFCSALPAFLPVCLRFLVLLPSPPPDIRFSRSSACLRRTGVGYVRTAAVRLALRATTTHGLAAFIASLFRYISGVPLSCKQTNTMAGSLRPSGFGVPARLRGSRGNNDSGLAAAACAQTRLRFAYALQRAAFRAAFTLTTQDAAMRRYKTRIRVRRQFSPFAP